MRKRVVARLVAWVARWQDRYALIDTETACLTVPASSYCACGVATTVTYDNGSSTTAAPGGYQVYNADYDEPTPEERRALAAPFLDEPRKRYA